MAFGVVYLILNKVNGKPYVGQTTRPLERRFLEHATCKKTIIGKAIQKYGRENFYCGVIKTCASKAEMDYWEKHFIIALKSKVPYEYNMTDGGEGTAGMERTPEYCAKLSAANMGNTWALGYHHTDEARAKISAASKGVQKSPEACANISAALNGRQVGSKNHNYGKNRAMTTCLQIFKRNISRTCGLIYNRKILQVKNVPKLSLKVE